MKKSQLRKLIRKTIIEQSNIDNVPDRFVPPPPPPPPPGPPTATPTKGTPVKPLRPDVSMINPPKPPTSPSGPIDQGNPTCNELYNSLVNGATEPAQGPYGSYVNLNAIQAALTSIINTCNDVDVQCEGMTGQLNQDAGQFCGCEDALSIEPYNIDGVYSDISGFNLPTLNYPPDCPVQEPTDPNITFGGDIDCTGADEYICNSGLCESPEALYNNPNIFAICYECCYNQDAAAMGVSPQDVEAAMNKLK